MRALLLGEEIRARIADDARAAFPRECCGLIEGMREADNVRAVALHPARNVSPDDDRFEIDPADQFRAIHAARANGRKIVGCYHSHPNGRAEPSPRDGDSEDGFIWLIAATDGKAVVLRTYSKEGEGWKALRLLPEDTEKAA